MAMQDRRERQDQEGRRFWVGLRALGGRKSWVRWALSPVLGALIWALPKSALAQQEEAAWEKEPALRRSGFMVGFLPVLSLGRASGYPLDLKKIGRERFYTESNIAVGGVGLVWLGGALSDWLTFGLGTNAGLLAPSDLSGGVYGVIFRTELFPLFGLGGKMRELGVGFDVGASVASFTPSAEPDKAVIDGGASSHIGFSVFYEGLRFWHFSAGPGVYADYTFSDTIRYGNVGLGFRTVLYSGAAAKKKSASSGAAFKF